MGKIVKMSIVKIEREAVYVEVLNIIIDYQTDFSAAINNDSGIQSPECLKDWVPRLFKSTTTVCSLSQDTLTTMR